MNYSGVTRRFLLVWILATCFVLQLRAQDNGSLRGLIADSTSGEPLPFANVVLSELGIGASTDNRGYFIIASVPPGRYSVYISYVGYNAKTYDVVVIKGKLTHIDVELAPSSYNIGVVEKVEKRFHRETTTEVSLEKISMKALEALPKGVETDVMRSLTMLPGVQSAGDASAKFYVRGSPSDQNLILLNGIPVYYPFHALGMFSVFDPEILSSVEFFKGGFTSEYSGRISSVLDMKTKKGNKKSYGLTTAASFLTAKALVEGPMPYGSFVLHGRMSHSNEILSKFSSQNIPIDFYDFSFNVEYANDKFMQNSTFNFFGFFSKDIIQHNNPELEDFNWSNNIFGVNYFQIDDKSPFFAEFIAYISMADGEVIPNNSNSRARGNSIKDITGKVDFHYVYNNRNELVAGLQIQGVYTDLTLQKALQDTTVLRTRGNNLSIFGKYKFMQVDDLGIDFGTRLNVIRLAGGGHDEISIEPRLNILYQATPDISLHGAWGLYTQEVVTITDEDEVVSLFDPWTITPLYIDPATAIQYVAGISANVSDNIKFETEGYYKVIHDLPIINEERFFASQKELIKGSSVAYGWEVSAKYLTGPFSLTCNYSLGWAFKTVLGNTYKPRYDSRHKISIISGYDFGDGWTASILWNYNSGLNFTQIGGYYYKYQVGNLFSDGVFSNGFSPQTILGSRNKGRMPDYHRLDINVSKSFSIGPTKFLVDLNLINVYDRANLFYVDRDTGERVNMLPFLPTATIKMEL